MTDIDHIISKEAIEDALKFNGNRMMFRRQIAILDETDSGLDIDALRIVANGVESLRSPDRAMLIITHYPRLLEYVRPDHVHVLTDGRITRSGDHTLALELEEHGYAPLTGSAR